MTWIRGGGSMDVEFTYVIGKIDSAEYFFIQSHV